MTELVTQEDATQQNEPVVADDVVNNDDCAPLTKMQVLMMYKQAVDAVKLRCPGFTRTVENKIHDINAASDAVAFAKVLTAIPPATNRSTDSVVTVEKDDDLSCRIYFPVYDTDYGCRFYDGSAVRDALCYENGQTYELIIQFHEQDSDVGISNEFSQMLSPFSQDELMHILQSYFPVLNENNCDTALRYYNCEIRCRIDKNSGHVLSLQQKMITQVVMNVNLDLILTETSFSAQAVMVSHLEFTDFIWN